MDYGNWTTRDDVKGQSWSNLRKKGHKQHGQDTRYGFTRQTIHNYEMCCLLSESLMPLCLPGATNILRHRPDWRDQGLIDVQAETRMSSIDPVDLPGRKAPEDMAGRDNACSEDDDIRAAAAQAQY